MEIETKNIHYEVIEGKKERFSLMTKAGDFPNWLNAQLSKASKRKNFEMEFVLREIKRAYEYYHLRTSTKKEDENWSVINKKIDESSIKRYDWNSVFGRSLTQEILTLKNVGHDAEETIKILSEDLRTREFLKLHKQDKNKVLENLKISVHARFGENNTAKKILEDLKQEVLDEK
jgi:hypothetical protein